MVSHIFSCHFLSYFPQQFHISIYLSEFTFSLSQSTLSLSIPSNFLLIFILLPRAIKDPLSHPAPVSSSFFRNLSPSNSILTHPPLCTPVPPPRIRFGGVSKDNMHVHLSICETFSARDSRLPMTELKCGRGMKGYLCHRIDFFRGRNCEALKKQVFISVGIYIKQILESTNLFRDFLF